MQRKLYRFLKAMSPLIVVPMIGFRAWAFALAAMSFGQQAAAEGPDPLASLVAQDVRLAGIADRLLTANDRLCRQHMPVTGLVLHSRDQYRSDPGTAFANGSVAVEAVVPGSPAAGQVLPGDGLVAIGPVLTDALAPQDKGPRRDSVFAAIADWPAAEPLPLTVTRAGARQAVTLRSSPGCRALVEIRAGKGRNARSDGRVIQIDQGLAAAASDEQLATIFAHEMAHAVLEHRRRLDAAGVAKGFFGEFGKNRRLNRAVEIEADQLSVHLLANAGYDPAIAAAFWRSPLGRRTSGLSAVYPSAGARAKLLEQEIAEHLTAVPSWPAHLLDRRDVPF
jgi:hypothetical protein